MNEFSVQGERRHRQGVHFDPSINLGHVITLVAILAGFMISWGQMNTRMSTLEALTAQHEKVMVELQISNAHFSTIVDLLTKTTLDKNVSGK